MLERLTIQELHGDERLAFVLANLVNGADMRMIERRSSLSLALETFKGLRVVRQFWWKEFESDSTVEPRVFGLVHHTHPATTELLRDCLANHAWETTWRRMLRPQAEASQRKEGMEFDRHSRERHERQGPASENRLIRDGLALSLTS